MILFRLILREPTHIKQEFSNLYGLQPFSEKIVSENVNGKIRLQIYLILRFNIVINIIIANKIRWSLKLQNLQSQ